MRACASCRALICSASCTPSNRLGLTRLLLGVKSVFQRLVLHHVNRFEPHHWSLGFPWFASATAEIRLLDISSMTFLEGSAIFDELRMLSVGRRREGKGRIEAKGVVQ